MSIPSSGSTFRLAPLAASLSMALALGSTPIPALATNRVVQNCGDGGPGSGSLRDMVGIAASGDTIELSQLPAKCGMADSVITLLNGEIHITQDTLKLQGPSVGSVTVEQGVGSQGRVFNHTGVNLLDVNDLTMRKGNIDAGANDAQGGCIYTKGSVSLTRSTVEACTATGDSAYGGGVYALDSAILINSVVTGNSAVGTGYRGSGGGIFVKKRLSVKYSTLSVNYASTFGGAIDANSTDSQQYISSSTIEGNTAGQCGAAALYTFSLYAPAGTTIANTTISSNTALHRNGGLCGNGSFVVLSSTIVENSAPSYSGGLRFWNGSLTLQSTIIAKNNSSAVTSDLYLNPGAIVDGADNLVMTVAGSVPGGVIKLTSDPKVGQLQYNGGKTHTHALLPGSPAIGAGNNNPGAWFDQRGHGYPRMTGPNDSTDVGAVQFDSIFYDDMDG